jgi:hypothetical protein
LQPIYEFFQRIRLVHSSSSHHPPAPARLLLMPERTRFARATLARERCRAGTADDAVIAIKS